MSYFQGVVTSLLSRYISDFGQDLSLSLWNGEMTAHSLVLKTEELRNVLPFNLQKAELGALRVVVPWTRLVGLRIFRVLRPSDRFPSEAEQLYARPG